MIHLYAEHLLNIRTLSIQASLSTVSNKETKAKLSADGSILTLNHEGESASIKLPINLSPNRQSNVIFTIPAVPSRELTFRIQLEEKEGVTNGVLSNGISTESGNIVPWMAGSLSGQTELCCKSCGAIVLGRGSVLEWKDLPSEGWAEMMDFWHCHKPPEAELNGHAHLRKGYTADSHVALEAGIGMVDAASFLLHSEDCKNIKPINSAPGATVYSTLRCANCETIIGQLDPTTQGYKLQKSQMLLSRGPKSESSSFSADKWLACSLLDAIEAQGVRKLVAFGPGSPTTESLKLWVFTPDLSISSSVRSSTEYVRVAKVLWQDSVAPSDIAVKLNGTALSEGELKLGIEQVELLKQTLERSNALLPEDAREFQGWHVGLLERFASEDIDSS